MIRDDWLLFPRTAAVAVVAAATALPALAQNTTSAVSGRVVGGDGRPVAGATVTITHQPSGTTVTATTDAEGRYAARGLRAGGPYTVVFQRGSDVDRRSDLNLALAETLALDGRLGAATQTITVTGRAGSASSTPTPRSSATCRTTPAPTRGSARPTRSAERSAPADRTPASTASRSTA